MKRKAMIVIAVSIAVSLIVIFSTAYFLFFNGRWNLNAKITLDTAVSPPPFAFVPDHNHNIHIVVFEHGAYQGLRYLKVNPNGKVVLDKRNFIETSVNPSFDICIDKMGIVHLFLADFSSLRHLTITENNSTIEIKNESLTLENAGYSTLVKVKIDTDDVMHLIWVNNSLSTDVPTTYYTKLDENHNATNPPIELSKGSLPQSYILDEQASSYIFWNHNEIAFSKVDKFGNLSVSERKLISGSGIADVVTSIDSSGNIYITYLQSNNTSNEIKLTKVDQEGNNLMTRTIDSIPLLPQSSSSLSDPSATLDIDGNIHICWHYTSYSSPQSNSLKYIKLDEVGKIIEEDTIIEATTFMGSFTPSYTNVKILLPDNIPSVICISQSGVDSPYETHIVIFQKRAK